ncbi:hypothetical protein OG948_59260 (plasmid) [Embleya sp. NBC_00888]|uniref:hypothetical protein n=1 Tax=Embleya sp. NBC_00888 TaxID=2975960 RepID=UPI002F90858A|nr:hypothetical protein OG948_59260 [Embleya sp. NBC_00888]
MHTPDHPARGSDEDPGADTARNLIESAGVDERHIRREHHRASLSSLCDDIVRRARERDYDETRTQFPDETIHLENGHTPYVRVRDVGWELRYFPPSAVEIHERGLGYRTGFSFHDDLGVPIEELASITVHDLRTRLEEWIKTGPRSTPSPDPHHDPHAAVLNDLRGSMDDGYDQDHVNAVLGRLNDAFGTRLVCVWDYVDPCGFGGGSNFYLEDDDGRLRELVGDLWGWLNHPAADPEAPQAPGRPADWRADAATDIGPIAATDHHLNRARRDLRHA